jgi:hypothetical protein
MSANQGPSNEGPDPEALSRRLAEGITHFSRGSFRQDIVARAPNIPAHSALLGRGLGCGESKGKEAGAERDPLREAVADEIRKPAKKGSDWQ